MLYELFLLATVALSFQYRSNGPSNNVPRYGLFDLLGLRYDSDLEWYYWAGHLVDTEGISYGVQLMATRKAPPFISDSDDEEPGDLLDAVISILGVSNSSENEYYFQYFSDFGTSQHFDWENYDDGAVAPSMIVPVASDNTFEVYVRDRMSVSYDSNQDYYVGDVGAQYSITSVVGDLSMNLTVTDERGFTNEGVNGFVSTYSQNSTFASYGISLEIAQPRLKVNPGGILQINNKQVKIEDGYLWLDRQMLQTTAEYPLLQPIYIGTWMALTFDNGLSMDLVMFWQPAIKTGKPQWITGTEVGLPPIFSFGNVWFPLKSTIYETEYSQSNGGMLVRGYCVDPTCPPPENNTINFDINILDPDDTQESPHWTSDNTGHTYATAWKVTFKDIGSAEYNYQDIYLHAFADPCENVIEHDPWYSYWEGAAYMYTDKERKNKVGTAFVEQMGFEKI